MTRRHALAGFTLVEMIVSIVVMGIIAGMVAVFIKSPVEGYFATTRRAQLSEAADAALRFIARDLQAALPNSLSVSGAGPYALSFLTINSGGRYREYPQVSGSGTPLSFGQGISAFDVIGASATSTTTTARGIATHGRVVVGNLSSGVSSCNSSGTAFAANSVDASLSGSSVTFSPTHIFPDGCNLQAATVQDDSGTPGNEINDRGFGRMFFVDSTPVVYTCGAGVLTRNGVTVVTGSDVVDCLMTWDISTNSLVQTISILLTLGRDGENIPLLRQIHVVNEP
jgi:MSHA biogenesis protein MshO